MKIAILYQKNKPPKIDGIDKPMKKGGYSDSGADIAYCLVQNGYEVITPVIHPSVYTDLDWIFPDTKEGIAEAILLGADTLWLNTVLYRGHPIQEFKNISIIGQDPDFVDLYDDKFKTNQFLRSAGLNAIDSRVISLEDVGSIQEYPCVIKPIRGRGSQGVKVCDNEDEAIIHMQQLEKEGIYGNRFMIEPFLDGTEITVGVFPDGSTLPPVIRTKQVDRIMPYNGKVPVVENSYVGEIDEVMQKAVIECSKAASILKPKAMIRIDCREKDGKYYLFDVNPKPNMTGAIRPHRYNQDSLLMIAMKSMNQSYLDLIEKYISFKWNNV